MALLKREQFDTTPPPQSQSQQSHPSTTSTSATSAPSQQQQYEQVQNANSAELEEMKLQQSLRKIQIEKSKQSTPKFLQYLQGGVELSLMVAIDFTGSNGAIHNDPQSLHNVSNPNVPSPYQAALNQICPIVAEYDSDKKFPVWGFGAKFHQNDTVSHCFAVNADGGEVDGVSGIVMAYLNAIQSNAFHLSGPCLYSHVLTRAINETIEAHNKVMSDPTARIQYYVLLILTNGQCDEKDKQVM